jgi:hypothetical protein
MILISVKASGDLGRMFLTILTRNNLGNAPARQFQQTASIESPQDHGRPLPLTTESSLDGNHRLAFPKL